MLRSSVKSGCAPLVPVVKTANLRDRDDCAYRKFHLETEFGISYKTRVRSTLRQKQMNSISTSDGNPEKRPPITRMDTGPV